MEYAKSLVSIGSTCLVECEADDRPELATGHRDEKSQCCDQQVGTRRAESERQAMCGAFGPICPEALVDVRGGVQGLRHWILTALKVGNRIGSLPLIIVQCIPNMSIEDWEETNDVGKLRELERVEGGRESVRPLLRRDQNVETNVVPLKRNSNEDWTCSNAFCSQYVCLSRSFYVTQNLGPERRGGYDIIMPRRRMREGRRRGQTLSLHANSHDPGNMTKVVVAVDCMNFLIKIVRPLGWTFRIDIRGGAQAAPGASELVLELTWRKAIRAYICPRPRNRP